MRMPTVPSRFAHSATGVRHRQDRGIDRLDEEAIRMLGLHLDRVAGVVAVHREGRHQDRAVDADRIHRRDHLVAGRLGRPASTAAHGRPG